MNNETGPLTDLLRKIVDASQGKTPQPGVARQRGAA
jgi:hypothetical protein